MGNFRIDPAVNSALAQFQLPEKLGFGVVKSPIMYRADCVDGEWQDGELLPYGPISIDPAAKVLHYAQEVFEGLKAYKVNSERASFFRPEKNAQRLNNSAQRLCIPEVPQELFMEGISLVTAWSEKLIPNQKGQSLYLRPFLIGVEPTLGMGTSKNLIFMVIASPSNAYHEGDMKILIEREACRAARNGTGAAKCGGNYAAAQQSARDTQAAGFDQSLWLDPIEMRYIEELSGMNVFAVVDGVLYTPKITGSFLEGITRDSIISLARLRGYEVVEEMMPIDQLLGDIRNNHCTEAFACGTAAIISPISVIADADGERYSLSNVDVVASELRTALLDIQENRAEDPFGWIVPVDDSYYPPN